MKPSSISLDTGKKRGRLCFQDFEVRMICMGEFNCDYTGQESCLYFWKEQSFIWLDTVKVAISVLRF